MNLTDLREELTAHADDLGTAPDFRAGIAARVRRTKRRRAVVTGSAATLAVAALTVGVLASVGRPTPPVPQVPAGPPSSVSTSTSPALDADGMPFRLVPDAPGDVVKDGLRLRGQVADDRLAVGAIGSVGQSLISADWTPTTTHVSLTGECYLPGADPAVLQRAQLRIRLQGAQGYFGAGCRDAGPTDRDLPAGGWVPGEPGQGWPELTVGRAEQVVVEVVDGTTGKHLDLPGVRVVGAVYELGSQTLLSPKAGDPAAVVPNVREHNGFNYVLADSQTIPAKDLAAHRLELTAPAAGPCLVTYGTVGTGALAPNSGVFTLRGLEGDATQTQEGGLTTAPQAHAHGQLLRLELVEGVAPTHGTGVIAIYVPAP